MKTKIKYDFGSRLRLAPLLDPETWERVRPTWKQVHGVSVAEVLSEQQHCGSVDVLWTRKKNLIVGIKTADCIPLLLYRRDHRAVAAIHAGWRGVLARIPLFFFQALPAELADPKDWCAVIGPSNRVCCYEFGQSELALFQKAFPQLHPSELSPKPGFLDVLAPLQADLRDLGVEVISVHPDCTFCSSEAGQSPRYLSYRRGDRDSQQFSMIQITEDSEG